MLMCEGEMTECDDSILIARAREDADAFGILYERYVNRIYNYIFHRVGNLNDAEDLTSRVFFSAYSHLASYKEQGVPFTAWLYRIAHNLVANWHRDRGRRPVVSLEEIIVGNPLTEHPEALVEQEEAARHLAEAIRTLDPERRELLVLKVTEGLSNIEIGRIMGKSEGAIKSLYHRTLLSLRKELQRKGLEL